MIGGLLFLERTMNKILDRVNSPSDLKNLNKTELNTLCGEIRDFLIDSVSETGGHLASNLGAVELTVALHTVFSVPEDKLIWDVGHQAYVHKLLTGRRDKFKTLRHYKGMSGFPKTTESDADCFNTGHSSTSISAALGIARARDLKKESGHVVAILGDGAFTGGMVWEALGDAGHSKTPLIVILNDNNMSISKNVGAVSKYLRELRTNPSYLKSKSVVEKFLSKIPLLGKLLINFLQRIKAFMRLAVYKNNLFAEMGFNYMGPLDGHDTEKLIQVLTQAKNENEPVFIHISTIKGKGYAPAEKNPSMYHGIPPFDKKTGLPKTYSSHDYSEVFGRTLTELGEKNKKIVAITGAMPVGTGVEYFGKKFKDRFFDVGIAEQHGVTLAAGLAISGMTPVIPLYSSFMQRAYDQILHDVCLQNLHVVFPVDRAGIVGADGETHQGVYDISFLSHMPNMAILSPANFGQLKNMLDFAINIHNGPIAIRYPRGNTECDAPETFEFSKVQVLKEDGDILIITSGRMIKTATEVADKVDSCAILALPVISPLDCDGILNSVKEKKLVITIEDNVLAGGFGEQIGNLLTEANVNVKFKRFGFPKSPIIHGSISEIDKHYGVDSDSISNYIKERL